MDDQAGKTGLLLIIRRILRQLGTEREEIERDLVDFAVLSVSELESTIGSLSAVFRPHVSGEGSSRDPVPDRTPLPGTQGTQQGPGVVTQEQPSTSQRGRRRGGRSGRSPLPPPTPTSPAVPPPPQLRTCIGTAGVECQIDPAGRILYVGGGLVFRRRMRDLVDLYMPQIHIHWRDHDENDKKYVLAMLAQEFGTGWDDISLRQEMDKLLKSRRDNGRQYAYVPENQRPSHMHRESWKQFRKEMRMNIKFPQQKEVATARVASGHTSHLGRMGTAGLRAIFAKDYGRPPTTQEMQSATHHGYKKLKLDLPPTDAFELHGETDMVEVARQVAAGLAATAQPGGQAGTGGQVGTGVQGGQTGPGGQGTGGHDDERGDDDAPTDSDSFSD